MAENITSVNRIHELGQILVETVTDNDIVEIQVAPEGPPPPPPPPPECPKNPTTLCYSGVSEFWCDEPYYCYPGVPPSEYGICPEEIIELCIGGGSSNLCYYKYDRTERIWFNPETGAQKCICIYIYDHDTCGSS